MYFFNVEMLFNVVHYSETVDFKKGNLINYLNSNVENCENLGGTCRRKEKMCARNNEIANPNGECTGKAVCCVPGKNIYQNNNNNNILIHVICQPHGFHN